MLRPHHLTAYKAFILEPNVFTWSDKKFIRAWRNDWGKGDYHSDDLVLHWRDTMKKMYNYPRLKFMYVLGIDTVCNKCEHAGGKKAVDCTEIALEWDKRAMAELNALGIKLKFGEVYTSAYITDLFKLRLSHLKFRF